MARTQRSRLPVVVDALVQAQARGRVHEFVVVEKVIERAAHEHGVMPTRRRVTAEELEATVFRDVRAGRGSASFTVGRGDEVALDGLVAAAATRASSGVGLSWRMPRPAAPARVNIADEISAADLDEVAAAISARIEPLVPAELLASRYRVEVEALTTRVTTSTGFSSSYPSTKIDVAATLAERADPTRVESLRLRACRRADLDLERHLSSTARRLRDRARAQPLPREHADILLREEAIIAHDHRFSRTGDSSGYGWFGPIVAQSSATLARQGLARYQLGQSIYGHRKVTGDPLTIISDGTIPFAARSRPFADLGEPVRRFEIVSKGIAAGLALDLREAALREVTPNGGLRNLVVNPGPTSLDKLARVGERALVEIVEIAWLDTNPRTGGFVAEVGLGYRRDRAGGELQPVAGGVITGNIFALLARARFARETIAMDWYHGPTAIRVDDVAIG